MKTQMAILTLALSLVSAAASAATAPGTSTASAPNRLIDKITAKYAAVFRGPSLGSPSSALQPDETGALSDAQFFDGALGFTYKHSAELSFGVSEAMYIYPYMGMGVKWHDPYLRAMHTSILSKGALTMGADFRVYLPALVKSREKGRLIGFRSTQYTTYEFTGTRWSLELETLLRTHIHSDNQKGIDKGDYDYDIAATPALVYRLNPKNAVGFYTDFYWIHNMAKGWQRDAYDFGAYYEWQAHSKVVVAPWIQIRPSALSVDSTQLGFNLSATLL